MLSGKGGLGGIPGSGLQGPPPATEFYPSFIDTAHVVWITMHNCRTDFLLLSLPLFEMECFLVTHTKGQS